MFFVKTRIRSTWQTKRHIEEEKLGLEEEKSNLENRNCCVEEQVEEDRSCNEI